MHQKRQQTQKLDHPVYVNRFLDSPCFA